jgi:hypothetical protein
LRDSQEFSFSQLESFSKVKTSMWKTNPRDFLGVQTATPSHQLTLPKMTLKKHGLDMSWLSTQMEVPPQRLAKPLVICYIAIEHGPFIVDLPIKKGDFPWLLVCLQGGKPQWNMGNFPTARHLWQLRSRQPRRCEPRARTCACKPLMISVRCVVPGRNRGSIHISVTYMYIYIYIHIYI